MTILRGEIAIVLGESIEGGWLQAMKGDEIGLVPETYMQYLPFDAQCTAEEKPTGMKLGARQGARIRVLPEGQFIVCA